MARIPIHTLQKMLRGTNPKTALIILAVMALVYLLGPETKKSDPHAAARGRYEGVCFNVLDGDTLDVRADSGEEFRLRLLGVDCMETFNEEKMSEQAHRLDRSMSDIKRLGERAKSRTRELVLNRHVAWEVPDDTPLFDPYDRMLAYVKQDGRDLGEILLSEGLAELRRDQHPRLEYYRSVAKPLAR